MLPVNPAMASAARSSHLRSSRNLRSRLAIFWMFSSAGVTRVASSATEILDAHGLHKVKRQTEMGEGAPGGESRPSLASLGPTLFSFCRAVFASSERAGARGQRRLHHPRFRRVPA